MALDSTPRRRFGVALGVVLTGVTAGLIGFAGSASAHTRDLSAECKGDTTTLHVNLKSYSNSDDNHVKITDGDQVLEDKGFRGEFVKNFETSGAVDHTFTVAVKASDSDKYSFTETLKVEKCVIETTTTTPPESTEPSTPPETTTTEPSETPTSSSTEAPPVPTTPPTTTTTTAEVDEAALAETGASIGLPLGIAGVLLVGGGVLLFVVRRRGKA